MTTQTQTARTDGSRDEDRALRPKSLAEAVGQDDIRANLAVYVHSALDRGEPLDHVLFTGPPGLGKTTLAEILANEMGVRTAAANAPSVKTKGELASVLTSLRRGDILFIDEIHALHPKVAEILYPALEDYKLDIIAGNQAITLALEAFTLIGATTDAGKMPRPLRERFGIVRQVQTYTVEQLKDIVIRSAQKLGVQVQPDGARELARRSRGTPRLANRILRRVRDFATALGRPADAEVVALTCQRVGIDDAGLDRTSRRYLEVLVEKDAPVALSTMTSLLGETKNVVEESVEPYLMAVGFVEKTAKGRIATSKGRAHLRAAA